MITNTNLGLACEWLIIVYVMIHFQYFLVYQPQNQPSWCVLCVDGESPSASVSIPPRPFWWQGFPSWCQCFSQLGTANWVQVSTRCSCLPLQQYDAHLRDLHLDHKCDPGVWMMNALVKFLNRCEHPFCRWRLVWSVLRRAMSGAVCKLKFLIMIAGRRLWSPGTAAEHRWCWSTASSKLLVSCNPAYPHQKV